MCQHIGGAVGRFASLVLRPLLGFLAAPQIVRLLSNANSASLQPKYQTTCVNYTAIYHHILLQPYSV